MALLKAVGAEDGKIMRVIINQSILSIIMAAFFSLIISGGIIGVLHSIQKNYLGGKLPSLIYPLLLYLLAVCVALAIVFVTSYIQVKSIEKYNLSEELKLMG